MNSDLDDHTFFEGDDFACDTDIVNEDNFGPKTEKRNRDLLHVEQIMQDAGWYDISPNGPADVSDLTPMGA